jgi:uncharacterized membrane protein (Fun14 family)
LTQRGKLLSEVLTPIVYQLGIGGILGFFVGYAVKKLTKLIAVLIGLFALLLIYFGYQGVISINYNRLAEMLQGLMGAAGQASDLLTPIVANLPFAGSFVAGTAVGLKTG